MRRLSASEHAAVVGITRLLWERKGERITDAHLAVHVGLPYKTATQRDKAVAKIRDLMGHVVIRMRQEHPGWTVLRPGEGVAEVTQDAERTRLVTYGRRRVSLSVAQRVDAEQEVVRRNSTDPAEHLIASKWAIIRQLHEEVAVADAELRARERERERSA